MDKIDDKLKELISSKDIQNLINKAYNTTENVLPKKDNLFEALKLCPLSKTKVVIFGQDPYYTKGVADGLAFSTTSYKTPLSLQNIFKQIKKIAYAQSWAIFYITNQPYHKVRFAQSC